MTLRYPAAAIGVFDGSKNPPDLAEPALFNPRIHTIVISYTTQADAIGDQIFLGELPKGARMIAEVENTDTSLGAATLAIGTAAAPAKYRAAHTLTGTDAPSSGIKAAALGVATAAKEIVIATIAAAALPNGATLTFQLHYTLPEGG